MVIHDVCKVIGREFIRPFPQDLVVQCISIHLDMASDEVVHLHDSVFRHLETDGPAVCRLQQLLHLVFRQCQRVPQFQAGLLVVDESVACSLCLSPFRIQFLSRVESIVSIAVLDKLVSELPVDAFPLGLAVWRVRMSLGWSLHHIAVLVHSFVGFYSAPVKCFNDILFRTWHEPVGIRILYSYDKVAAVLLGEKIVVQCCPDSSHVQRSCRGRSESYSCFSVHFYSRETPVLPIYNRKIRCCFEIYQIKIFRRSRPSE